MTTQSTSYFNPSILDVDKLRKLNAKPYYFGLGFIQMKLTEHMRLHFWHCETGPIVFDEEIHDHRYGFHSRVLTGAIENRRYLFLPADDGAWSLEEVGCDAENPRAPIALTRGKVVQLVSERIGRGEAYTMTADEFHRSQPDFESYRGCVTLLTRETPHKQFARKIVPLGTEHICPFSKPMPEARIWELIDELVAQARNGR